jgi:CII-binding regulator of phage lambda lysogenization HflD|tara:strand:- start:259 stop:711 length:453 start_codon:yes stop_codon:yes gene_type:complete
MLETVFSEVIILFAVVSASISSIIVTKNLFRSSPLHAKERNRFTLSIAELEKDNKKLRGKVNQMKQPISIKEFDEENPMGAISELISGLAPILPASVRPFLSNPGVIKGAEKLLAEHPEEIKNVLSKLVNKKPNAKEQTNEQSTIDSMSV